jgi:hypothetical protein
MQLDLENGIFLVPTGRREAAGHSPIVLLPVIINRKRNAFEMLDFDVERSG